MLSRTLEGSTWNWVQEVQFGRIGNNYDNIFLPKQKNELHSAVVAGIYL